MRLVGVVYVMLCLLIACGAPSSAPEPSAAVTPAPTAVPSPSDTVTQALALLARHDAGALMAMYDPAISDLLRASAAMTACNAWDSYNLGSPGRQDRAPLLRDTAIHPPEPRGADTLVPVLLTYADEFTPAATTQVRWDVVLRLTDQGWRIASITTTEQEDS